MSMIKRLSFDTAIFVLLSIVFITYLYQQFSNPLQGAAYDVYVRSIAILQAHISRKLLFPKVDWNSDTLTPLHIVVILWYLVFIFTAK